MRYWQTAIKNPHSSTATVTWLQHHNGSHHSSGILFKVLLFILLVLAICSPTFSLFHLATFLLNLLFFLFSPSTPAVFSHLPTFFLHPPFSHCTFAFVKHTFSQSLQALPVPVSKELNLMYSLSVEGWRHARPQTVIEPMSHVISNSPHSTIANLR